MTAATESYASWKVANEAMRKKQVQDAWTPEDLKRRWLALQPVIEIAEAHGVSESTIRKRAAKQGLRRRRSLIVAAAREEEILRLWPGDKTIDEIAKAVSLSRSGVAWIAKKHSLKRRPFNPQKAKKLTADEKWVALMRDQVFEDVRFKVVTQ